VVSLEGCDDEEGQPFGRIHLVLFGDGMNAFHAMPGQGEHVPCCCWRVIRNRVDSLGLPGSTSDCESWAPAAAARPRDYAEASPGVHSDSVLSAVEQLG